MFLYVSYYCSGHDDSDYGDKMTLIMTATGLKKISKIAMEVIF